MEYHRRGKTKHNGVATEHQKFEVQRRLLAEADYCGADEARRHGGIAPIAEPSRSIPALGAGDDYILKWIAQTDMESSMHSRGSNVDQNKHEYGKTSKKPQAHFQSFRETTHDAGDYPEVRRKRRRDSSSSDSSLLEPAVKSKLDQVVRGQVKPDISEEQEKPSSHPQKKRKPEPSDEGTSVQFSNPLETFEKRPRRKTRDDRYEPKKKMKKSEKPNEGKRSRTKREKKGDKRKAAKKAGEDLMQNFSSNRIAQERLTIRPPHGLGVFNNGRASSPIRRRGLADLAFSEMRFLQRSSHVPSTKKKDTIVPKSREKETRRAERARDEISTFFKPKRTPLEETEANAGPGASSTYMSDQHPIARKRASEHHYTKEHIRSQPEHSPKYQHVEFQSAPFSDTTRVSSDLSHSRQLSRNFADTISTSSGEASTCVTWSETQFSPITTTAAWRQLNNAYQYQTSPIPNAVKRLIENTGIFRDTGIVMSPDLNRPRERTSLDKRCQTLHLSTNVPSVDRSCGISGSAASPSSKSPDFHRKRPLSGGDSRSPRSPRLSGSQGDSQKQGGTQQADSRRFNNSTHSPVRIAPTRSGQTIIENYEAKSGWHQHQDPIRSVHPDTNTLDYQAQKACESAPVNREQLAQNARIKRPPTELPAAEDSREEVLQYGMKAQTQDQRNANYPDKTDQPNALIVPRPGEGTSEIASSRGRKTPLRISSAQATSEHESRARETIQAMQQDFDLDAPVVTHPNSDLFVNEPATRCSSMRPLRNGLSTETAAPLRQDIKKDLVNRDGDSLPALLIGGFWKTRDHEMNARLSRLSPIPEHAPLYVHQLQRSQFHEARVPHEENYISHSSQEHFGNEGYEMLPYLEDVEFDLWERNSGTVLPQGNNHFSGISHQGMETFEDYSGGHNFIPEIWDEEDHAVLETENYDLWDEPEQNAIPSYETFEGVYRGNTFGQPYGEDARYEQPTNEEEGLMQGFWRPYRSY